MMIARLALGLALLLTAAASQASTTTIHIPAAKFRGSDINCFNTDLATEFGQQPYAALNMANLATTCHAENILFPPTCTSSNAFTAKVYYETGTNGSQKYCWAVGFVVSRTAATGGKSYGTNDGTAGTEGTGSSTDSTTTLGYMVSANIASFNAYDWNASADCTSTNCVGFPGIVTLVRDPSTAGCSGGTTATAFPVAVDLFCTGP